MYEKKDNFAKNSEVMDFVDDAFYLLDTCAKRVRILHPYLIFFKGSSNLQSCDRLHHHKLCAEPFD